MGKRRTASIRKMNRYNLHEKTYVFCDGFFGKKHKVKLCTEPIIHISFTNDFAKMIQLFRSLTDNLDFSRPFRMVIEYNPEQLRVRTKIYKPTEVLEQHVQRVKGKEKALRQQAQKGASMRKNLKEDRPKGREEAGGWNIKIFSKMIMAQR